MVLGKNNPDFKTLFPKIKKSEIEAIPISNLDFNISNDRATHEQTVVLVDQILAAKSVAPDADVSELENEIDKIVYSLYNLTPEEIAIVEENTV